MQVVGLGFVGLTLAVFLAKKSKVIGVEISAEKRELIQSGSAPFFEPHLDDALGAVISSGNFEVTSLPIRNEEPSVFIITVGTPVRDGNVDLDYLGSVVQEVASVATDEDLVILRSTVSLGTTRDLVHESFRKLGVEPKLAMCPERTLEGSALKELASLPQIVGGLDSAATNLAVRFFEQHGITTEVVDSPEAAELCKLSANAYRDLQFAFSNELAMLGDARGVNVRQVIEATNRRYPRSLISRPGPSAGPCLEKDPWILVNSGESIGVPMRATRASREVNEALIKITMRKFCSNFDPSSGQVRILVAGIAFKGSPETDDTRGSLAFDIMEQLSSLLPLADLTSFDPLVSELPARYRDSVKHLSSLENVADAFDGLIVQHAGETLHNSLLHNVNLFRDSTVLDYWGEFEKEARDEMHPEKVTVFGGALD